MSFLKIENKPCVYVFLISILVSSSLVFCFPTDVKAAVNYKIDLGFTFTYLKIYKGEPAIQYSYRITNMSKQRIKGQCFVLYKNTNATSQRNLLEISNFIEDNSSIRSAGIISDSNETRTYGGRNCECFVINIDLNYELLIIDSATGLWLEFETFSEKVFLISWQFETSWLNLEDGVEIEIELNQILGILILIPAIFALISLYQYLDKRFISSDK